MKKLTQLRSSVQQSKLSIKKPPFLKTVNQTLLINNELNILKEPKTPTVSQKTDLVSTDKNLQHVEIQSCSHYFTNKILLRRN